MWWTGPSWAASWSHPSASSLQADSSVDHYVGRKDNKKIYIQKKIQHSHPIGDVHQYHHCEAKPNRPEGCTYFLAVPLPIPKSSGEQEQQVG